LYKSEETCCFDFQPSADAQKRDFKIKLSFRASGVPLLEIKTTCDERPPLLEIKTICDERPPLLEIKTICDERPPLLEIRTTFNERPADLQQNSYIR
jgi:hypothetical protein